MLKKESKKVREVEDGDSEIVQKKERCWKLNNKRERENGRLSMIRIRTGTNTQKNTMH